MTTGGSAPQEWLSLLERDERRELFTVILTPPLLHRCEHDRSRILAKIENLVSDLLDKPWVEALTMQELRLLDAIPGWDWAWSADAYEEKVETSLLVMVEWLLMQQMDDLFDEADDWIAGALFHSPDSLLSQLTGMRNTAKTYEIDLKDLNYRRLTGIKDE